MIITLMIPTYRRVPDLRRCLEALTAQRRPADEVIVPVRDIDAETRRFLDSHPFPNLPLRSVQIALPGVVAAMNAALAVATGQIIALTDDDAAPWPDWLERINAYFEADPELGGLGGRDWQYYDGKLHIDGVAPTRCGQLQWFGRVSAGHHLAPPGSAYEAVSVKGVNSAYRAEALKPIGFDTRLAGTGAQVHWELSLGLALCRNGWKILFDPSLGVDHFPAARFDEDERARFNDIAQRNAVANETLILLENLKGLRRIAFLLWAALIGTRAAPGIAQLPRLLALGQKNVAARWSATWRGRLQGIRMYRLSCTPGQSPPGTTT
jgi:cellulose synthase/poly-beta-1,6-N-acetylglucosamine synthase-like glycosyltransferase